MALLSRYLILTVMTAAALLAPSAHADAPEQVTHLTVTAQLTRADVLTVTEVIDYDFGVAAPHATDRTLPLAYHDDQGTAFPVKFQLVSSQLDGQPARFPATATPDAARLTLPAPATPGLHHYQLGYRLTPVVLHGNTADILKVPVTGLNWPVTIAQTSVTLTTPNLQPTSPECVTGVSGTTTGACQVTLQGSTLTVSTTAPLASGQGLSLSAIFKRSSFTAYLQSADNPTGFFLWVAGFIGLLVVVVAVAIWLARRTRRGYTEA